MLKLVKFLVGFVFFMSFGYVLFFVPLGERTLYQHLRNISATNEAQALKDGIREKAQLVTSDVVENVPELKDVDEKVSAVRKVISTETDRMSGGKPNGSNPSEQESTVQRDAVHTVQVTREDRTALDNLVKRKLK